MTILEIYAKYNLMQNLQEHQLRVAAVAQMVCDAFHGNLQTQYIVSACMLHDMGNILKFDLAKFPEFLLPQGLEYWESVKADVAQKYCADEHEATYRIAKEIGVSKKTLEIMQGMGSSKARLRANEFAFETKIATYADMRVGPHGILPLRERVDDMAKRYAATGKDYRERGDALRLLEKQIFAHCQLTPEDINDVSVRPLIETLKGSSVL